MTILITGGAGYLGSVLVRQLLTNSYYVKVIDNLMYNNFYSIKELLKNRRFEFIRADITDTRSLRSSLKNVESVVHLAGLVGDPVCNEKMELCMLTNYKATKRLARLCLRNSAIEKFIYISTCSVYGETGNMEVDESGKTKPIGLYSKSKLMAEEELMNMNQEGLPICILRLSTLYGLSPRMRFDLVVNLFVMRALSEKKITVFGGNQLRPFLHVQDAAKAIQRCLKAPLSRINGEIYNVGANTNQYTIMQLANLVAEHIRNVNVFVINDTNDPRSYCIDCTKIFKRLGFKCEKSVKDGIQEIRDAILSGKLTDLKNSKYYNYNPE